ncbi:hypothetical protein WJX75_006634 [Coccomyxa subellipsoidea]|uniref:Uncharacterized protein n=1 Tax=Coccomyxa subellipsoidea TaxID=248742 RepID=A0ABR2YMB4_9CHLO
MRLRVNAEYSRQNSSGYNRAPVGDRYRDRGQYDYPPPREGSGQEPPPTQENYGVWFNSEATFYPSNVASTEVIDRRTPNSEVCMANGYSSMVFDERVFVSFNPFNVYVTQPEVKPGCVLRRANIGLLEKKKLVTDREVGACTKNMNTFGFVGDLNGSPEVSCVYHSEDGENQFLRDPKRSVMGDGFQPHELLDTKKTQAPAQN